MAAVIRNLLSSPLASHHDLEALTTHKSSGPLVRLAVFAIALVRLVAWCARPGARIVHVHATVRGSMIRKAVCVGVARAMRRPVLLHVHAGAAELEVFAARLGGPRRRLVRRLLGTAGRLVSVSTAGKRALEESFGLSDVVVVPNPAPPSSAAGPARRGSDRAGLLYLGGFANPVKGGEILVEALDSVAREVPSLSAVLAGPGEPPPAARRLLDEQRSIRWLGWLEEEEKADAMARNGVFVLPSTSEGLPMALLEAMANGMAIVATDMGGVPDVLENGVNALIVAPGDAADLAAALTRILTTAEDRESLAAAAAARAEDLNASEVCARLDAIYRELAVHVASARADGLGGAETR